MKLRRIRMFFIKPNALVWDPPRSQYQQQTDIRMTTRDELILIRKLYARNAIEARRLLTLYGGTAESVITTINRQRPGVIKRLMAGFKRFVAKLEGSSSRKIVYKSKMRSRIP